MEPQKSDGPARRGDAPAGPEMLSAVDGASVTANPDDRQVGADLINRSAASLVLIVAPVPALPGFFTARLAGDDRLLARSRTPLFDAARALLAAGFDPTTRLTMLHAGSAITSLSATIATAARFIVEEGPHGPKLRRFQTASQSGVGAVPVRLRERAATTTRAAIT